MHDHRQIPTPPGVALIGGGFIGPVHAEALRRLGLTVVGLLGSSPERARPTADRLGVDYVYEDLDDLLSDPAVGAVHIASPNRDHFDQARRSLESGRHVVCEKPLAVTSVQTAALAALAATRPDLAAAVNYNVRYYPLAQEMKARVARGDLGRVLSVTGSYVQDWLLYPTDYNWRVEPDGGANLRAAADIGTHWMDLAQFVVGRPIARLNADLATFHEERRRPAGPVETFSGAAPAETVPVRVETEDYASVLLHFDGGARGVYHVSQAVAGRKNRLTIEVAGTEAALAWDSESPESLWIGRRGRPNELLMRDPSLLTPEAAATARYPGGHAEGFPDTFAALCRSIYGWIAARDGSPPPFPTFADGHREAMLCEAIARSGRGAGWVDLDPP